MKNKLAWVLAGIFAAVAIALISVWLPGPLKKLGLFSCLLGSATGYALWKLREVFEFSKRGSEKGIAFLLGGFAEGVRISESYRIHLAEQQRRLALEMEKLPGMFPTLKTELTERVKQGFSDYLSLRYSAISKNLEQNVGTWLLFVMFAIELLLASGAAFFVYRYLSRQTKLGSNESGEGKV